MLWEKRLYTSRFRSFDGGIKSDSRYFAMVRLATWIPCSSNSAVILLSLRGLRGFSASTSFLIRARIAVDEHSPPAAVLTWLEKKYLSSKIPRGVCIYLWVVTLEIVDFLSHYLLLVIIESFVQNGLIMLEFRKQTYNITFLTHISLNYMQNLMVLQQTYNVGLLLKIM